MALYERQLTADEMTRYGLTPEDFEEECQEVWPENWQAFQIFLRVGTQWRAGTLGATGLDYNALYPLLDRADGDWDDLFDCVRAMEQIALDEMRKK